jgi:hypothetical protein
MVYTDDIGDLMGCYDGYDGPTNEPDFAPSLYELDDWWRHNGIWDREQASGILVENFDGETQFYLESTDDWWDSLSDRQKQTVYDEFFEEQ